MRMPKTMLVTHCECKVDKPYKFTEITPNLEVQFGCINRFVQHGKSQCPRKSKSGKLKKKIDFPLTKHIEGYRCGINYVCFVHIFSGL